MAAPSILAERLQHLQDRVAALLGTEPASRQAIVLGMLRSNDTNAGSAYWLPLLLSVGIATLGLVLGSGAVVIGAMLIAPLMTPILNLGMGLAVGSPFLVLRSSGRVIASGVIAISASALTTWLLPFHELNPEIAARTTPTVLDLLVAALCALAGVYAAMRQSSDVAATAAGTSIGISLVPPLCASGFGIGTSTWSVASGAALLFLTNFVAIVVVSTISFSAAGFYQVDVRALEQQQLGAGENAPVARRLAKIFASRGGPWLRLLMPFVLLAGVYVPLGRALDEVVWQIRARKEVQRVLGAIPQRIVQSHLRVERRAIDLSLILLGTASDAKTVRSKVDQAVLERTGIHPRLDVMTIPDANAFASLQASMQREPVGLAPKAAPPALEPARERLHTNVERRWPANEAGPALSVSLETKGAELTIEVTHLGAPLGSAGRETLERALGEDFGRRVRVIDQPLPTSELTPKPDRELEFVAEVAPLLERARKIRSISVCAMEPPLAEEGGRSRKPPRPDALRAALTSLLEQGQTTRVTAERWSIRFVAGACPAVGGASEPAPKQ